MSLDYPWRSAPSPSEWLEIAPGISWLRFPLPFALDHVNVWLIESDDGFFIVDTGVNSTENKEIWSTVLKKLPRSLSGLLVTHYHPDHLGLAEWLIARQAMPIWFSQGDLEYSQRAFSISDVDFADAQDAWYSLHGLDARRRKAMRQAGNTYRPYVSGIPAEPSILKNSDIWVAGGKQWQVITAGGHAPEMICLYCSELNVLICADQILPAITPNVSLNHYAKDPNPLLTFLGSLPEFELLPHDVLVLPSHGLPYRGLHERTQQLKQHHQERFDRILEACVAPSTATDLLPVLFARKLDYQQLMFAMGESIAHLRYLNLHGALSCTTESGQHHYQRCN